MRVFITGASGFIGRETTKQLIEQGHSVLGLARSDKSAEVIKGLKGEVIKGELTDLDVLKKATKESDAVLHLGFVHDFSSMEAYAESTRIDKAAIGAITEALEGTDKPLGIASGLIGFSSAPVTEDTFSSDNFTERVTFAQEYVDTWKAKNVRGFVVRLPPTVHGKGDKGFINILINTALKAGKAIQIDKQTNRWAATHVSDAATVFILALEKTKPGSVYHAVDELVSMKDIWENISTNTKLPLGDITQEQAVEVLGPFFTLVVLADVDATSTKTRTELGWKPKGIDLLSDMTANYY